MNNKKDATIKCYLGTSGLILPVPNKLSYPEEFKTKSRLTFYSSLLNTIEINSSFYKVPMVRTVAKWANEVPEGFKFTFKLSKEITHHKDLAFDPEKVKEFIEVISVVGDKKGCLLVQFPPSVRIGNLKQLQFLMATLRKADPDMEWNISFEFRHPSLYCDRIYSLLAGYKIGLVLQDKPAATTPMLETNLPFIYLRFHGPEGNYRGSYPDDLLFEYAEYITDWLGNGKTVYCYFNNTMGAAVNNLATLQNAIVQ